MSLSLTASSTDTCNSKTIINCFYYFIFNYTYCYCLQVSVSTVLFLVVFSLTVPSTMPTLFQHLLDFIKMVKILLTLTSKFFLFFSDICIQILNLKSFHFTNFILSLQLLPQFLNNIY